MTVELRRSIPEEFRLKRPMILRASQAELPSRMGQIEGLGFHGAVVPSFDLSPALARRAPILGEFYRVFVEDGRAEINARFIRESVGIRIVPGGSVSAPAFLDFGGILHGPNALIEPSHDDPAEPPDLHGRLGVGAEFAHSLDGGRGEGVRVAVCEGGADLEHPSLVNVRRQPISARGEDLRREEEHGTATLGVLGGAPTDAWRGGLCPGSEVLFASENGGYRSQAIGDALTVLGEGDVMLVALTAVSMVPVDDPAFDEVPAEYDEDVRAAFAAAEAKGITVVEAAGNDGCDLGDVQDALGQLIWCRTSASFSDSGAILVGAGEPETGRISDSNHGERVDCQAWGFGVTTIANRFTIPPGRPFHSGTSAAAAIIAGVVACIQSRAKTKLGRPLAPRRVREILLQDLHGRPQPTEIEHIGPLPNLEAIFTRNRLA